MTNGRRSVWIPWVLLAVLALASTGCAEAVGNAARGSLASFLTQVFSTAVNSALLP